MLDAEMRAAEFELLGRMWERLPLRRLQLAEPRPRPDEVCQLVLDDLDPVVARRQLAGGGPQPVEVGGR